MSGPAIAQDDRSGEVYQIALDYEDGAYRMNARIIEMCETDARQSRTPDAARRAVPDDVYDCIGRGAEACMAASDYSTRGMSACSGLERQYWSARLESALTDHAAFGQALHGDVSPTDDIFDRTYPARLAEFAAQWATYREATCDLRAAVALGGTASGLNRGGCWMRMTAEQALMLEYQLGGLCGSQLGDHMVEVCTRRGSE